MFNPNKEKIDKSEMEVFMKEFDLKDEKEFLEARQNLLGFFNVLYKIDQRLKKESNNKTDD